jgi:glycosyltransferase involved in cell wall biosynthesis
MGLLTIYRQLSLDFSGLIYLNSLFSPVFTLWPLLLRRLRLLPSGRWILAPRGELLAGALSKKAIRKRVLLRLARASGLLEDVLFHATSEVETEAISKWFGPSANILFAPDVPPAPDTIRFGPTLAKAPGAMKIVYLGRIDSPKNLGYLLERLGQIRGSVELQIIGPVVDEGYATHCMKLAHQLPASCRVLWLGPLEHGQALAALRENHLLVIPSLSENYGFVVIEALLSGCPVLASDQTPWTNELVPPGGMAIALENREGFEAQLQTWIDLDQTGSDRRRKAARQLGEQHVERVVPRVLSTWLEGPLSSRVDFG